MKLIRIILFIAVFAFNAIPLFSQWQPSKGIEGGHCYSIFSSDSILLTGCAGMMYRTNLINEWEQSNSWVSHNLHKVKDVLFAYSSMGGIERSFDNGITWEVAPYSCYTGSFCSIDSTIFFSYYDAWITKSENYMDTIEFVEGLPKYEYSFMRSHDSLLFVLFNEEMEAFQTIDLGNTWDTVTTKGLPNSNYWEYYDMICYNNTIVICADSGVFYLNETRDNWIKINNPLSDYVIFGFKNHQGQFLAKSYSGIYELNSDYSWNIFLEIPFRLNDFCFHENELYLGTLLGVYHQDSLGNLNIFSDGIYRRTINSMATINDTIYIMVKYGVYYYDPKELYKSNDHGQNFQRIDGIYGNKVFAYDNTLYILTDEEILITNNDFITTEIIDLPQDVDPFDLSITNNHYFLITQLGTFRSNTNNISWFELSFENEDIWYTKAINSTVLSFCNKIGGVILSQNSGINFDSILNEMQGLSSIEAINSNFYILSADSIVYSHDMGINWDVMHPDIPDIYHIDDIDVDNETILIGSSSYGPPYVQLSYDFGINWVDITDSIPYRFLGDFYVTEILGNRVFCSSTGNSLWYRDDVITGNNEHNDPKEAISDIIVYPNPASNQITIELSSKDAFEHYRLSNLYGQILLTGNINSNKTKINLSDITAGVYIIQILGVKENESKKIIIY